MVLDIYTFSLVIINRSLTNGSTNSSFDEDIYLLSFWEVIANDVNYLLPITYYLAVNVDAWIVPNLN